MGKITNWYKSIRGAVEPIVVSAGEYSYKSTSEKSTNFEYAVTEPTSIQNYNLNIGSNTSKAARVFSAGEQANMEEAPFLPDWFWHDTLGVPRRINPFELRKYAKSAWVQMVKRTIKNQIMTTKWEVVNTSEDDEEEYKEEKEMLTQFLNHPNRNGDSFWKLWGAYLDDTMDLDAGVIWKGRNFKGELKELYAYDGSRFLIRTDVHGLLHQYLQFSYQAPQAAPIPFEKEDIIYGKIGVNTDQYPYGWSPLQSIQQIVELMIQSDRWNKEFFKNNAIPDSLISIPMEPEALERFETDWKTKVQGEAHKTVFINSPEMKYQQLSLSNKDMEWLEGQKWYFHVVFGSYGLSPAEVGFYDDVNRASQEGQERVSVKNAVRPYFELIAENINREIFPELIDHDKVMFKWFPKDDQAEKLQHEQTMAKLDKNVLTINEVRKMEGLEDVDWGSQPMAMGMAEQQNELDGNEDNNPKDKKDNPKKEDDSKEKGRKNLLKEYGDSFNSFVKKDKDWYKSKLKYFIKNDRK